jgi:Kef-type K+ transport system membrane component KefB
MNVWDSLPPVGELAWPVVIALAWLAGELAQRWRVPRVTTYALVGFAFGRAIPEAAMVAGSPSSSLLASIAFGLILFEFGYRINLRWFRVNPWLAATGLLDVALTFVAVYALCRSFGAAPISALLIASMTAATSPASLTRVVNELRSAGQVTERALHLTAFNCLCALLAFKFIVGFWTFDTSGDVLKALSNSVLVLLVSAGLGAAFGSTMPALLRITGRTSADATLAFALAVVLLVGLTHVLRFSPLVATLAFGLVARHRRVTLSQNQRNFGVLGDLLVVFLFTYVAATVDWQRAVAGAALGAALVVVRAAAKIVAVTLLAHASGTTWRKGMLTAIAMSPLSTFVVLLVQDTRAMGIDLIDAMAPVAAATLLLQWIGPLATQMALVAAGEVQDQAPAPAGKVAR